MSQIAEDSIEPHRAAEAAPPSPRAQRDTALAVTNALGAYLIWGVVGWFFKVITVDQQVPPLTLLAQRAVWSLGFICIVLAARGELGQFIAAVRSRRVLLGLTATSLLIGVNWITFIYAAWKHLLVEASVGYFLSPLMSVLLGVALLGERLRRGQVVAIATATIGVGVLVVIKAGVIWIPIALMVSWSFYVLLRKRIPVGPMVGLGVETAILSPFAAAFIVYDFVGLHTTLSPAAFGLLALSGIVTATPLIMFAYAARRLSMASLGLSQYVGPTVQFIVAALILREPTSPAVLVGFAFIWLGLIIFSVEGFRTFRRANVP